MKKKQVSEAERSSASEEADWRGGGGGGGWIKKQEGSLCTCVCYITQPCTMQHFCHLLFLESLECHT